MSKLTKLFDLVNLAKDDKSLEINFMDAKDAVKDYVAKVIESRKRKISRNKLRLSQLEESSNVDKYKLGNLKLDLEDIKDAIVSDKTCKANAANQESLTALKNADYCKAGKIFIENDPETIRFEDYPDFNAKMAEIDAVQNGPHVAEVERINADNEALTDEIKKIEKRLKEYLTVAGPGTATS